MLFNLKWHATEEDISHGAVHEAEQWQKKTRRETLNTHRQTYIPKAGLNL
jgi:hypothetical protein